jgi:hypothetical protein
MADRIPQPCQQRVFPFLDRPNEVLLHVVTEVPFSSDAYLSLSLVCKHMNHLLHQNRTSVISAVATKQYSLAYQVLWPLSVASPSNLHLLKPCCSMVDAMIEGCFFALLDVGNENPGEPETRFQIFLKIGKFPTEESYAAYIDRLPDSVLLPMLQAFKSFVLRAPLNLHRCQSLSATGCVSPIWHATYFSTRTT